MSVTMRCAESQQGVWKAGCFSLTYRQESKLVICLPWSSPGVGWKWGTSRGLSLSIEFWGSSVLWALVGPLAFGEDSVT